MLCAVESRSSFAAIVERKKLLGHCGSRKKYLTVTNKMATIHHVTFHFTSGVCHKLHPDRDISNTLLCTLESLKIS